LNAERIRLQMCWKSADVGVEAHAQCGVTCGPRRVEFGREAHEKLCVSR
jgi:hypothetical protein